MTETPASSRVTQRRGNGAGGGSRADYGAGGIGAGSNGPDGDGLDKNGADTNGTARYTEADLEPIRARLAAFARGEFRPRGGPDDRPLTPAGPGLAEISHLADEIAGQLAAVTSEVAQSAAQVRDIALIPTAGAPRGLTGKATGAATGGKL